MKKIIFGSIAAIGTVIGFSSFKTPSHGMVIYYYFKVSNILADNVPVTVNHLFDNDHISIFLGAATTLSDPSGCSNTGTSWCAVGFTRSQVTTDPFNPGSFILYTAPDISQPNLIFDTKL